MVVSGIELYPVEDISELEDRTPVYIKFDTEGILTSQWGIVDQNRRVTIHKDFTLSFNDRCKYYVFFRKKRKNMTKGVIVQF